MARSLQLAALASGSFYSAVCYKAAFVEHEPVDPCQGGSCGKETRAANVKSYVDYMADAASQGAEIIVFPEYGITGESSYPKSSWVQGGYTETIPEPAGQVPCDAAEQFSEAPSVVSLSCAAKQHKIAVVANLIDYSNGNIYNTDVALDTDGKFLAKYHKLNLWGERNIDIPSVCSEAVFTTSFGVKFGMFTCADLIFEHPALDMVSKGITNFVMPTAWSNEMAEMQTIAYAQGWSLSAGVNLIMCNLRGKQSSGSGIWTSGKTLASEYTPGAKTGRVVVADVPTTADAWSASHWPLRRPELAVAAAAHNQTKVRSTATSKWAFTQLSKGQVCSGSVCCSANVTSGSAAGYVLGALDGTDGESFISFPAQVCAVLPCESPGSACLSNQQPSGKLQGLSVHMIADGSVLPNLVPEVLATSGTNSEVPLTPGAAVDGFTFSRSKASTVPSTLDVSTSMNVVSALIYGRRFDQDQLPYACKKASAAEEATMPSQIAEQPASIFL